MKEGSSLQELARQLEAEQKTKRDFVAPTTELEMSVLDPNASAHANHADVPETVAHAIRVNGYGAFDINEIAHEQIASRVGIPQKYYDRMRREAPHLLNENVNHWFARTPEKRMIRTLSGTARAFLSDRYRPLDNLDMAQTVLPVLHDMGVRVESSALTDRRLYIKAVTPKMTAEVKKGDVVQAGIVVSNSEVGLGSVKVEPMVFRLVCSNGLIVPDYGQKRYHVGRALEAEESQAIYRDETLAADDAAFLMKVQDTVRLAVDQAKFAHLVNRLRDAAGEPLSGNPVSAVELMANRHALTQDESGGVLRHLVTGGDFSRYGLLNAVTRTSQEVADYDRATELERLGGKIMTLDTQEWRELAVAA